MIKLILFYLKLFPLVAALVSPFSLVYNLSHPWQGDEVARLESKGYIRIPIGLGFHDGMLQSKGYALVPISFQPPKWLQVSQFESGNFDTDHSVLPFWVFLFLITYGWYLIYGFIKQKSISTVAQIET